MDRKTLEYMEERAKKAREIVTKIERLAKNIENIKQVWAVVFYDSTGYREFDSSLGGLTEEIKKTYVEAATQKIQELEQQLAEL